MKIDDYNRVYQTPQVILKYQIKTLPKNVWLQVPISDHPDIIVKY